MYTLPESSPVRPLSKRPFASPKSDHHFFVHEKKIRCLNFFAVKLSGRVYIWIDDPHPLNLQWHRGHNPPMRPSPLTPPSSASGGTGALPRWLRILWHGPYGQLLWGTRRFVKSTAFWVTEKWGRFLWKDMGVSPQKEMSADYYVFWAQLLAAMLR